MATLSVPPALTSPRDDAMQLYRAFKGFGCDTAAVVNILAHRDATQRSLIEQEYKTMYSEDLSKRLSSELSGDVKRAILLWMPDPALRDATIVRQALTGDVIDLKAATEVICSRTSSQIQHFKQIYHARFHAYLEHDIEYQATGDHKEVHGSQTVALSQVKRTKIALSHTSACQHTRQHEQSSAFQTLLRSVFAVIFTFFHQ